MARLLLGVSGGIAAYKALELARLAIKAGHAVRVIQTEASTRFVGTASFAGITGAPVLVTEWEPDPLRGAFPGDPAPDARAALAPRAGRARRRVPDRARLGQHDRQARRRPRRQPADRRRARLPATADRRSGHERGDVRARRHPGEPRAPARARRRACSSRAPARSPRSASTGTGRLPEPPELLAAFEAALRAGRELDGLKVLVTAGGTREPIDAVRYVGNRSSGPHGLRARRGGGAPRRRRDRRRRQRLAPAPQPASSTSTCRPPPSSPPPARSASTPPTCC